MLKQIAGRILYVLSYYKRAREERAAFRAAGLCEDCGKGPPTEGFHRCYDCQLFLMSAP